jgi:pimeloyl-ACP methyl ester carboxylesterase
MKLDHKIQEAETRLFARGGLQPEESFLDLYSVGVRLRVLSAGAGPPLVMLPGVSLVAAVWAPWLAGLAGYRALLVELPGHGLSGPVAYRPGAVRDHGLGLVDGLFDALGLATAPVLGHSLGGMLALWHAAARPGRIASLVAIGDPAVTLPGGTVRLPLSLLTVPVLGQAMLRTPTPRPAYRRLLGQGLSPVAAAATPDELHDVLRLAVRRKPNAKTVAGDLRPVGVERVNERRDDYSRGGSVPPRPPAGKPQQWFTLRSWVFDATLAAARRAAPAPDDPGRRLGTRLRTGPRPPVPSGTPSP